MPRLLGDQNWNNEITLGLRLRVPALDFVSARDAGVDRYPDDLLLEWAASRELVVLTHDIRTLVPLADARVARGLAMPGVIVVPGILPVGRAVEDLTIVLHCAMAGDFENLVR